MLLEYQLIIFAIIIIVLLVLFYFILSSTKQKHTSEINQLNATLNEIQEKLEVSTNKLQGLEGKTKKTSFVVEQIKKIENLEEELVKQKQRATDAKKMAQESSMVKYDFLSNVSHEIRTPLNSILVFAELIAQEEKDKKLFTYANNIFQSGHKLLRLMDNVIDLAKIEMGSFDVKLYAVDTIELFEQILEEHNALAYKKGLELTIEIDEEFPTSLILDAQKIREILHNLIENALKFTNSGFVKVKISSENMNIHRNSIDVKIKVEDSGVGIEVSEQEKIFKIFEKREHRSEAELQGTGLGLSINKKMAMLLNGDITLWSTVGKGSTFTLTLFDVEIVLAHAKESVDEEKLDFSLVSPEGAEVLVVDSEVQSREIINECFLETAVNVVSFDNPRDAIEHLKSKKVNLIFIDIDIFSVDDNAVSKVIAKMSQATVVTLTTRSLKDVEFSSSGARVVGHLKKPVSKVALFRITLKELNSLAIESEQKEALAISNDLFDEVSKEAAIEFLAEYKNELEKLYKNAIATNDLNAMALFAKGLLKLSHKHKIKSLLLFAKELLEHIELFDIDIISSMMLEHKSHLTRLQNL